MGKVTNIEWTHLPGHRGATWNPWYGCRWVSTGCDNCYADSQMTRYGRDFNAVTRAKDATFYAPLHWKEPRGIFTCSWGDFFIKDADPWREEAWEIIKSTPQHTYMILTKRPGLMDHWAKTHPWPDHVWAGTSVESPFYLPRLTVLNRVPAKIKFVSVEPLLEGFDPSKYFWVVQWVIVGGESGPNYRPMPLEAMVDIVSFCEWAGLPVFVKQDSGFRPGQQGRIPDAIWALKEFPNGSQKVVRSPKWEGHRLS